MLYFNWCIKSKCICVITSYTIFKISLYLSHFGESLTFCIHLIFRAYCCFVDVNYRMDILNWLWLYIVISICCLVSHFLFIFIWRMNGWQFQYLRCKIAKDFSWCEKRISHSRIKLRSFTPFSRLFFSFLSFWFWSKYLR